MSNYSVHLFLIIVLLVNIVLLLPQIIKVFRQKTARTISLWPFAAFFIIQLLVGAYGLYVYPTFLLACELITIAIGALAILASIYYLKKLQAIQAEFSFREILKQMPGHLYWKDKNSILLGCNTHNWQDFGLKSLDEFIGKTDYDLFPQEQAEKIQQHDREVMRTGIPHAVEEETTLSDGRTLLYLSHKVPFRNQKGEIIGVLGSSLDVTSAKQETFDHLKLLEDIIAAVPEHVYWLNRENKYLGCNDAQAKSAGLNSREEIVGKKNEDLPWNKNAGSLVYKVDEVNEFVMATGQPIVIEEGDSAWVNGEPAVFLSSKRPLRDREGDIVGMVGVSVNITDRKKAEAREKAALKEAAEAAQAKMEEEQKFSMIAAQVAHDIRSPLSALDIVTRQLSALPEQQRVVLRSSINSIRDIANNLLSEYQQKTHGHAEPLKNDKTRGLLLPIMENVISEKRLQFEKQSIELDLDLEAAAVFAFVEFNALDFKRLLSNLINNGAEAMPEGGRLTVSLKRQGKNIILLVRDTGRGIPPEVMGKLFQAGASFGKKQGSGLGLIHAKQAIEDWGGSLNLSSKFGQGTTVEICLPVIAPPQWSIECLNLHPQNQVIVMDDDPSMHAAWDEKFFGLAVKPLMHFRDPAAFLSWVAKARPAELEQVVLLSDYELLGFEDNGLDAIEKSGIQRAVLVTSYFEEAAVIQRCVSLGVKLLPKRVVAYLQLELKSADFFEALGLAKRAAIFLDDDEGLVMAWKLRALDQKVQLFTYGHYEDFLKEAQNFDRRIPVFIDLNFGKQALGFEFARYFHEAGFENIFIATGQKAADLVKPFYVKEILGKIPPF